MDSPSHGTPYIIPPNPKIKTKFIEWHYFITLKVKRLSFIDSILLIINIVGTLQYNIKKVYNRHTCPARDRVEVGSVSDGTVRALHLTSKCELNFGIIDKIWQNIRFSRKFSKRNFTHFHLLFQLSCIDWQVLPLITGSLLVSMRISPLFPVVSLLVIDFSGFSYWYSWTVIRTDTAACRVWLIPWLGPRPGGKFIIWYI